MPFTRRQFATLASAAVAVEFSGCTARPRTSAAVIAPTLPATLREAGALSGILAGSAVSVHSLRTDPSLTALFALQCGIAVTENDMKMQALRPTPTRFFFDDADLFLNFCEQHKIKVRGHNFVWHMGLPAWFDAQLTPANAEQFLTTHIETVAGRYAGRMHSWDVVNEALEPKDKLPGMMRNSVWQRLLPGYLDIAFQTARGADPHALLVYNDYGIEGENPQAEVKRQAVLDLLRGMQARNVPVDALGVQSHLDAGAEHHYGRGLRRLIADVRSMGLKVLITELDVNDRALPAEIPQRDAAVGQAYADYLQEVLADPAIIALLTWGLTDRTTWLNGKSFAREDGLSQRCLPFDAALQSKAAFSAEIGALMQAPRR